MTNYGVKYRSYNPGHKGCTYPGCGVQDTATVDGVHGRRCAEHPPTADDSPKEASRDRV